MFRRKFKPHPLNRIRNFLWPSIGWERTYSYWMHRIARLPGSHNSISAGFAFGAAVSFTPFIGLHFLISAIFAWIFRVNILASAIGTVVGNPWTFPFIWVWIYKVGIWMGFDAKLANHHQLDFAAMFGNMVKAALRLDWAYIIDIAWPVFGPMLLGSVPTGIVAWFLFYFLLRWIIGTYRAARVLRLKSRSQARSQNLEEK